ncbi:MAG: hypothetical protein AB7E60_00450 [Sphingobium sp.]
MRIVPVLLLLLAACSKSDDILEELPDRSRAGASRGMAQDNRIGAPAARPVTIGEDGPRLDACGALGQVTRSGAAGLALHAAPFADAQELGRLPDGQRTYICTRSLDQKWLGVVVPADPAGGADGAAAVDCGVSSPVERKQPYGGPCAAGWVASAYVRLIGG